MEATMHRARGMNPWMAFCGLAAFFGDAAISRAQYQQPQSYSDYYRQQYELSHAPPKTAANYTINKYYYHNKNISPYSNLVRPSGFMPNYQMYVEPEVQRRTRIQQAQAPRPVTPYVSAPNFGGSAKMSAYSRKYGGYQAGP